MVAFLKWEETLYVYDDNETIEEIDRIYGRK